MLTTEQKKKVLAAMDAHMKLDKYGRTTIRNLYYDTDTYLLIRRSIEKPTYKEKLRLRSYAQATPNSTVFPFNIGITSSFIFDWSISKTLP